MIYALLRDRRSLRARDGDGRGDALPAEESRSSAQARTAMMEAVEDQAGPRMRQALAAGLSIWMLTGIVLFSAMVRLHPRYVEGFTPAVAAFLGIGVAWAGSGRGRAQLTALVVALAVSVVYVERLLYGLPALWWVTVAAALAALALAILERAQPGSDDGARANGGDGAASESPRQSSRRTSWTALGIPLLPAGVIAFTLVAVLTIPLGNDVRAIDDHVTDAGTVGAIPGEELRPLSAYLLAHQGSARYEVAAESATQIGALIAADARPVLILTSYDGRVFTSVAKLKRLIAQGQVRYAFLNSYCSQDPSPQNAGCSAPVQWIRAHGTDVTARAGIRRAMVLWLLPGPAR
jgi:hypothetical protein